MAERDPRDYRWPAAELILAEIKGRLAAQTAQKNALDTKAGLVVTGGAVFLAAVLRALLFPAKTVPWFVSVFSLAAVVALAVAIGLGRWAYWLIRMERPPDPRALRFGYLARTEERTAEGNTQAMPPVPPIQPNPNLRSDLIESGKPILELIRERRKQAQRDRTTA